MRYFFDLDDTVIDSSHRQRINADGSIDLAFWRANSTPEKIMLDAALPLAEMWRRAKAQGDMVNICTSRVMSAADFAMLESHGLTYDFCLSRQAWDDRPCGELKLSMLREYAARIRSPWAPFCKISVLFDDNIDVQDTLGGAGFSVLDPIQWNQIQQKATA